MRTLGHTNREDSNRGYHSLVVVEYRPPVGIYFRQSLSFWILGAQRIEALSSSNNFSSENLRFALQTITAVLVALLRNDTQKE